MKNITTEDLDVEALVRGMYGDDAYDEMVEEGATHEDMMMLHYTAQATHLLASRLGITEDEAYDMMFDGKDYEIEIVYKQDGATDVKFVFLDEDGNPK